MASVSDYYQSSTYQGNYWFITNTTAGNWISGSHTWPQGAYIYVDGLSYLDTLRNERLSFVPKELADEGFEPIQGEPEGARYLVSYMFKESVDPVVFVKLKKEAMALVKELMEDDRVDYSSILVSQIRAQFRPKKSWVRKVIKSKEVTLEKVVKKQRKIF